MSLDLRDFPTTRYQGSKRKILPWIYEHLHTLEFDSALDLFGGTASVSYLLKRMGKKVWYNDSLRFNYLIGVALIENNHVKLTPEDTDFLTVSENRVASTFVTDTFKNIYFTHAENGQIDAICSRIMAFDSRTVEGRYKAAIAYYALFQACLVKRPFNLFHRKNLYLRRAKVQRSFGNKRTWDYPLYAHFANFVREANTFIFPGQQTCEALNHDALDMPSAEFDLVYIDPPYLAKHGIETANYSQCYHFLEGLANYDSWKDMIDYTTANRRFHNSNDDVWIDAKKNIGAFDDLFDRFRKSTLVLSYKKHGKPSLTTLLRLLRRHGRHPKVHTRRYSYALNRQNGDAQLNREALIIA